MSNFVNAAAAAAILSSSSALPPLSTTSIVSDVPAEWLKNTVPHWPFQPGMRMRTKGHNDEDYELILDHGMHTFHYNGLSGSTPSEILTKMAESDLVSKNVANSAWSSIWVTDCDGIVNVCGTDLLRAASVL
jgi:hypothetical protein